MYVDSSEYKSEVTRFLNAPRYLRMQLLQPRPFYGYSLTALKDPVANPHISTMQTDGVAIRFNPAFTTTLTLGELNFVLMHELSHILLMHCTRRGDREPELWNVAGDYIVNYELTQMISEMRDADIPFEIHAGALLLKKEDKLVNLDDFSTERLYNLLQSQGGQPQGGQGQSGQGGQPQDGQDNQPQEGQNDQPQEEQNEQPQDGSGGQDGQPQAGQGQLCNTPGNMGTADDVVVLAGDAVNQVEEKVQEIIRDAILQEQGMDRNSTGHGLVTRAASLVKVKKLNWKTYLKRFFTESVGEDSSYLTPERKYLPFDLILPGRGHEEKLDDLWVFIDSSGSVGDEELNHFLGQVHVICKDFNCRVSVAFWDTRVHSIFLDMESPEEILKARPAFSGGTSIECVFQYIKEQKLKAAAFLICTDGYVGKPDYRLINSAHVRPKTIIALSESDERNERRLACVGKLVSLY